MRNELVILFYLKKEALRKTDGSCPVMVRLSRNGERVQLTTDVRVSPEMWDNSGQKVIGRSDHVRRMNLELEDVKASLIGKYKELKNRGADPSPQMVRDAFFGIGEKGFTLLELFAKLNGDVYRLADAGKVTRKTYTRYALTYERLRDFLNREYQVSDMDFRNVGISLIQDFEVYLLTVCKLSRNTASKPLKYLKKVLRQAQCLGLISNDPFQSFKIKTERTDRGYLTEDELLHMGAHEMPSKRLGVVRDAFLFSCFTGLSYGDVCKLTTNEFKCEGNDVWLITKRNKTGIDVRLPLMDVPLRIFNKYVENRVSERIFPLMSNQKVNDYLKEIAAICGIEQRVTFHLARHTFATTVTLEHGVPIETVSKLLGHTDIKTTQIYARITKRKIESDMNRLKKKLSDYSEKCVV